MMLTICVQITTRARKVLMMSGASGIYVTEAMIHALIVKNGSLNASGQCSGWI